MSEWEEKVLGDFITLKRGYDLPQRLREDGTIPIYSSSGISGFHSESKVNPPGVVTGRYGSIGSVFLCTEPYWPLNTTLYVQDFKGNDAVFVYYFLQKFNWHQFNDKSAVPGINRNDLHAESVLVPQIKEQKEIAAVLSCLDRKIENLRRQNETLEAIAQTLFKHWFIDFEFPNAAGEPYKSSGGEMVRSPLGEIPAGWRVGQLGDVVKVNADSISKDYEYSEIEYVDISSVGVGVLEGTTSYQIKEAPSRARRLVKHGDVIWSGVRPNRKSYLFISHPSENLVVSTGFITLTPDLIPSSYLYSWVTTDAFVEYLTFNASGSAYPAVKAEHFEIAEVLLPDNSDLSRFHAVVKPMREKIYQNSCQIQTLTQTRDVLLPKLMSGQLRIQEG